MIKLSGSRFTDIMPDNLASQAETQAFAYAVGRQIEKLCAYSDAARTYAAIATMPEWLLDYMAVELRTPSYNRSYSIATKRALVENSMLFYARMGTPEAVNQIVSAVFGQGRVEEWFEYGGQPHRFRVVVEDPETATEFLEEFLSVLDGVKRLSSWLDSVTVLRRNEHHLYAGFAVRVGRVIAVGCEIPAALDVTYLADENGNLLADEAGNRIIDEED